MSFQYLKKEKSEDVDFLPADKHPSFLLADTIPGMTKIPWQVSNIFAISQERS